MDVSSLLLDYGYSATESTSTLKSIFSHAQISRLSEQGIAEVLITLCLHLKNHVPKIPPESKASGWNPLVLASVSLDSVCFFFI